VDNSAYIYKKVNFNTHDLLAVLKNNPYGFLLESAGGSYNLGRYSFFGLEPFVVF
jgi:hypothetical protein